MYVYVYIYIYIYIHIYINTYIETRSQSNGIVSRMRLIAMKLESLQATVDSEGFTVAKTDSGYPKDAGVNSSETNPEGSLSS